MSGPGSTGSGEAEAETQRSRFYAVVPELLDADPRLALVLADIGLGYLEPQAIRRLSDRIINVGIREQLLIGTAGGLALAGLRPIVHSFAPFLVERPFEGVKLDLGHQGVGAVLVSAGGSYGWPGGGETHFGSRDVSLLDTLAGWTVHVPGHPQETEDALRRAVAGDGLVYLRMDDVSNAAPLAGPDGRMAVLRQGSSAARGTVIAVGPLADRTLAATAGLDVTVLYAATVRPFDAATLCETLRAPAVVLVEPYLAGTSVPVVAAALVAIPSRIRGLGVSPAEQRRYGEMTDHDRLHGLDEAGIRASVAGFLQLDRSPGGTTSG